MTEEEKKEDAVDMIYGHIHSKYLAYSVSETSAFSISNLQNKIKELLDLTEFKDDEAIQKRIEKKFRAQHEITVKEETMLIDPENKRESWYTSDFIEKNESFYWNRFNKLISANADLPKSIHARLDKSSDKILGQLGNPAVSKFTVKGMVMGNVQSGKTLSYTAVINKAIDAGYKLIILLTGMTESLRSQTQKRINGDVIGQAHVDIEGSRKNAHVVGVGKIDNTRSFASVLTTENTDFNKIKQRMIVNVAGNSEPTIMIVKKNKHVLQAVNSFIANQDVSKIPVLLIDDEADNASVNTADVEKGEDPKAINNEIRTIVNGCERISYLAYTATPMANFFIDQENFGKGNGEMEDLFPSDFLIGLEAPINYCGGEWFFVNDSKSEEPLEIIDDIENHLPSKHKSDFEVRSLPESLIDAIGYFIVVSTIKDIRRERGELDNKSEQRFDVCMVNVTVNSKIQNDFRDTIQYELDRIYEAIRANGALQNSNDITLKKLEKIFDESVNEDTSEPLAWEIILSKLTKMKEIVVVSTNSITTDGSLDWSEDAPQKQIVVGGFMLSRGLTLPGLTVSYYARNSVAFDTMMQMGRWFGYRDGYKDLIKLWATPKAINNFSIVTRALLELNESITLMMRSGNLGPKDFGIKVKTHPDLMVTAKNKSRAASDYEFKLSFQGAHLQTWAFFQDRKKEKEKEDHIFKFLSTLKGKNTKDDKGHILFKDIASNEIMALLNDIKMQIHPNNSHIGEMGIKPDLLIDYLNEYKDSKFEHWDVAIYTQGSKKKVCVEKIKTLFGEEVGYENRSIRGNHDTQNDCIPFSERRSIASANTKFVGLKEGEVRDKDGKPILIFHFINARLDKGKTGKGFEEFKDDKFIALSILLPQSDDRDDSVTYTVNQVYYNQHIKPKWDEDQYEDFY